MTSWLSGDLGQGSKPGRAAVLTAVLLAAAAACAVTDAGESLLDTSSLDVGSWPAGESEIAFYQVHIEGDSRVLLAESVLSPTRYDQGTGREGRGQAHGVDGLKWRFFYEVFEGPRKSYHVRGSNYAVLRRDDLAPLKRTWGSATWESGGCCGQQRRWPDGSFGKWPIPETPTQGGTETRGDYTSTTPPSSYGPRAQLYMPWQIPLVVRFLDFGESRELTFWTVLFDGSFIEASARLKGLEDIELPAGSAQAERIELTFRNDPGSGWFDGLVLATHAPVETFWRRPGGNRQLLRWDSKFYRSRGFSLILREEVRADYRRQDVYSRLTHHSSRLEGIPPLKRRPLDGLAKDSRPAEAAPLRLDEEFLTSNHWNDGKSEIAFFAASSPELGANPVLAGTLLTKHHYNWKRRHKTGLDDPEGVSTFLWIGIAQYDSDVSNRHRLWSSFSARQHDLRLLSSSASQDDWDRQAGLHAYLAEDGRPTWVSTALDEPRKRRHLPRTERAVMPQQLWLVLRALDFKNQRLHSFSIETPEGEIQAVANLRGHLSGQETVEVFDLALKPTPTLSKSLPSPFFLGLGQSSLTLWRRAGGNRQIIHAQGSGMVMTLIEETRAKHWEEKIFPSLKVVRRYP